MTLLLWIVDIIAVALIVSGWLCQRYARKHQAEDSIKTHPCYYASAICFSISFILSVGAILYLHLY
jgi:hypothetical protein